MKLPHARQSLWISTQPSNELPQLSGDLIVDVAIVGGGITGLTAALHLRRAGKSVVVIDAHTIAEGVTGHTTAHLTEALDARYTTLARTFGDEGARLAAESTRSAIHDIEEIAGVIDVPCGFRRLPGFLYTESESTSELEAELDAASRAGVHVSLTNEVPLPFARAALRFEDQAQMHPREYALGLARLLAGMGVRIYERTRTVHVHERTRHRVITDRGVVHAAHVIYATHTPLDRFALQSKLSRYQSYVLAFASPGAAPDGLFWDTEDPYHYVRSQTVGAATLLLVGGEDHKTGQEHDTGERYARLAEYARERFGVESIHFMWSSQVIVPVDGLPYIGASASGNATYVATGYAGNGMTFGTLAGRMLSDAILGRANRYAELYAPSRIPALTAAKDFVMSNIDIPLHMIGARLKHASAPSLAEVARGEGKIVRHEGELLAVYRDEEGVAHALRPKCTHMGCFVEWNRAESTWDCPCHGSRFATSGEVLTGPATTDLPSKTVEQINRRTSTPRASAPLPRGR